MKKNQAQDNSRKSSRRAPAVKLPAEVVRKRIARIQELLSAPTVVGKGYSVEVGDISFVLNEKIIGGYGSIEYFFPGSLIQVNCQKPLTKKAKQPCLIAANGKIAYVQLKRVESAGAAPASEEEKDAAEDKAVRKDDKLYFSNMAANASEDETEFVAKADDFLGYVVNIVPNIKPLFQAE